VALAPEIVRLARPPQEIIDLLYGRSDDGCCIALHTRRPRADGSGEGYLPFTILPIRHRQAFLPFLDILPDQTKALGVHTLKRSAMKRGITEDEYLRAIEDERPRYFNGRTGNVAELVAIFADLDVGKPHDDGHPPISAVDAILEVQRLAYNGAIPFPSMLALSGTGAYALWCLKSDRRDKPPKCTTENVHLWQQASREIHRILDQAILYPDPKALARLTQVMKAPDTIDTRTGNKVVFTVMNIPDPITGKASAAIYSLHDLIERLDLPSVDAPSRRRAIAASIPAMPTGEGVPSRRYALAPAKNPSPKDGGTSKAQAPWRRRYQDIETVAQARGGFRKGTRHHACLHYYGAAWAYYKIKHPPKEAHRLACVALADFNRRWCNPPRLPVKIERIMRGTHLRAKYYTVMKDLKITDDEARRLALKQLMPKADRDRREQAKSARSVGLHLRRTEIERHIRDGRTNAEIYAALPDAERSQVCRQRQRLKIPDPKHRAHPSQMPLAPAPAPAADPYAERRALLKAQAAVITGQSR
jgi:hypothetical protein